MKFSSLLCRSQPLSNSASSVCLCPRMLGTSHNYSSAIDSYDLMDYCGFCFSSDSGSLNLEGRVGSIFSGNWKKKLLGELSGIPKPVVGHAVSSWLI